MSLGRGNSSTPSLERLCRTRAAPCSTSLVWLLWVTWVPSTYRWRRPLCDMSRRFRHVLSILRLLKNKRMEFKVVCDLSPAVCVSECSCFALLVTPWLRGTALYCHSFALFYGSRLLALHVLSHVLSHVVLGPLSNVIYLTHPPRSIPLGRFILTGCPFWLGKPLLDHLFDFFRVILFSLTGYLVSLYST